MFVLFIGGLGCAVGGELHGKEAVCHIQARHFQCTTISQVIVGVRSGSLTCYARRTDPIRGPCGQRCRAAGRMIINYGRDVARTYHAYVRVRVHVYVIIVREVQSSSQCMRTDPR